MPWRAFQFTDFLVQMNHPARHLMLSLVSLFITGCSNNWNSPYSTSEQQQKILYNSFSSPPKHLDPAKSYSSDEYLFIENIYEPPLQYNYLKRPYQLEPLTAVAMPKEYSYHKNGKTYTIYDIKIKSDILYAPHPALEKGRQVTAADYIYQIKRLADPKILSPIAPIMAKYIDGFAEFAETLRQHPQDINKLAMSGLVKKSPHHYQIWLKQPYPQFKYWLSMPFFTAMPPELIAWHNSPERPEGHLGIDWYPHGSGPFMMTKNNPNDRLVLTKNPNFHREYYPDGQNKTRIPLLDQVIFNLEKESIPYWHKFLQGYYDLSGVSSDNFDQAIQVTTSGDFELSETFAEKQLQLKSTVAPSIYYMGFNMLDPIVGGYSERKRKLRQAISIAIDLEEFIAIFANGRAIVAQGPIPPGIFGYQTGQSGLNPYVYEWRDDAAQRRSLATAKKLLSEAGYPNGIDPQTNKPLRLNYDAVGSASDSNARLEWYQRQFKKLNIDLNLRLTDYNRFREKVNNAQAQILSWGWNADYPDPENFLFLLLGSNAKATSGGENAINYQNPEFDALFQQMKVLPNSPQRQQIINRMLELVRRDAPWNWGFYPKAVGLYHAWVKNVEPLPITKNILKYRDLDVSLRNLRRQQWNQPDQIPLYVLFALLLAIIGSFIWQLKRRQNQRLKG